MFKENKTEQKNPFIPSATINIYQIRSNLVSEDRSTFFFDTTRKNGEIYSVYKDKEMEKEEVPHVDSLISLKYKVKLFFAVMTGEM